MALRIYDTLVPQGDYPAVKAEHVQMPDGTPLSEWKSTGDSSGSIASTVTILEETTVEGFADAGNGTYFANAETSLEPFVLGETYTVKWDGTEYELESFDFDGAVALGFDTADPFGLTVMTSDMTGLDTNILAILTVSTENAHTLAIYKQDTLATQSYVRSYVERYISEALGGDY